MTIGEKIRRIRKFRNMTQYELGTALGFQGINTDTRIGQYENGYRIPRNDVLKQIAEILNVNYINFVCEDNGSAESLMQTFFWMDETNPHMFRLFQMKPAKDLEEKLTEDSIYYKETTDIDLDSSIALCFNHITLEEFLTEWKLRLTELKRNEITRDEYFEWKLNWPATCDDANSPVKWRKNNL